MSPSDSFDEATADMINDGVTDLHQAMTKIYFEKDEAKKVGIIKMTRGTCMLIITQVLIGS